MTATEFDPSPRTGPAPEADAPVTVVIPCRNEEHFIGACLDSVRAQTHQALEILVVDGGSEDATASIVRAQARLDPRIRLLSNPDRIVSPGLNRALEAATTPWLVRVDAHCTIPHDYVANCLTHLLTGQYGGVGGRKDGVGATPAGRAIAAAMSSKVGVGNSTYHHGSEPRLVEHIPFGAYSVDLARQLGGWDESVRVNQDFEFDHRVIRSGKPLLFDPAIRIEWHCRQSIADLFRQYRRYGHGKADVVMLHPSSTRPRHLLPAMFVLGVALLALPVVPKPLRAALRVAVVGSYGATLATGTWAQRATLNGRERSLVPVAFIAMHVGQGVGFWQGLSGWLVRRLVGPSEDGGRGRQACDTPAIPRDDR